MIHAILTLSASASFAADKAPSPILPDGWTAAVHGFVEVDAIVDSSHSYTDAAGNATLLPEGTYGGDHGRFVLSARDSRVGVTLGAPPIRRTTTTGTLELDFLGNQ